MGGGFSDRDFLAIMEVGESSSRGLTSGGPKADAKGTGGSSSNNQPVRCQPVRECDFISPGMYRLAKSEDCEWRRRQAAEVREMLFRTTQPHRMRDVMEQINSDLNGSVESNELHDLDVASMNLEASLRKIESLGKRSVEMPIKPLGEGVPLPMNNQGGNVRFELDGLDCVPTTHEVIHNHSCINPHPTWVWISKTSTVDKNDRLGFLATDSEVRRFGAAARKIFLRKPPSVLQKSFAQVVEMGREDGPSNQPWKRRNEDERGDGHGMEEDLRAKRQMGSRAQAQGSNYRGPGWDSWAGGSRNQEGWLDHWPPDPRGYNWPAQDQRRPPGRQERQDQGGKQ
jgi:hypothetical protein